MELRAFCNRIQIPVVLWLCLLNGVTLAQTVTLNAEFDRLTLDEGLEYFIDVRAKLSLDQIITEKNWQTWEQGTINFGFSDKAIWLRCRLANEAPKALSVILEIAFPVLEQVDVYVRSEAGPPRQLKSGGNVPLKERPQNHSLLLYPFMLPANTGAELYIRIHSDTLLQLPIALSEQKAFVSYDHVRSLFFGSIYGLLAAIGLYHCLLYFSIRDKAYLHYGLFVLSLFLGYFLLNGTAGSYLWPTTPSLSLRIYMVLMLAPIYFSMQFVRLTLNLENTRTGWNKSIGYIANTSLVLMPFNLLVSVKLATLLSLLLANASALAGISVTLVRIKDGYPPARYLLLAGVFVAAGIFITLGGNLTLIPTNFFTIHAIYVGIAIGAMLYSFALANRINLERAERDQAQSDFIQLQRSANEKLDRLVQERTQELEASNKSLKKISDTDGLTQLYNRRYFDDLFRTQFQSAFRSQKPLSVLLLDVDHFKQINDRFGHQFGDTCLVEIAKTMHSSIRRPPDVVARYGGEEFVILLPETDQQGAQHVAETIRLKVAECQLNHQDEPVRVTASIGICSIIPDADATTDTMLKCADDCLYRAKQNGRNRAEF